METCLENLWEIIREPVTEIIQKPEDVLGSKTNLTKKSVAAEKTSQLINIFFTDLEECLTKDRNIIKKPEHIVPFQKSLIEFCNGSVNGVREGAKAAKELASDCKLCAVCRGCSEKFYDSIIEQKMEEKSLPPELEDYFLMPAQMYYYQQSMKGAGEQFHLQDRLLCLKGFSSSTPTVYSVAFDAECMGGGLYINYKGLGIVIDPGIGFVNSMHKYGIYINNIDVVIITHDHLDHNADAKVISSLLYDLNSYNQRRGKIAKQVFELEKIKEHSITWIVDNGTKSMLKKNVKVIKSLNSYVGRKGEIVKGNKGIRLSAIHTQHIKNSGESYGIKFILDYGKPITIGYTSDTAFFPGLISFFDVTHVLVFNISDIYRKDVKGIQDKHSHLGYNGSAKLLKGINCKLAIASEFCCTNGDIRMELINTLSKEIRKKNDLNVIPGEIGLDVYIPELQMECSICRRLVELKDIYVLSPQKEYGKIQYTCRRCVQKVL